MARHFFNHAYAKRRILDTTYLTLGPFFDLFLSKTSVHGPFAEKIIRFVPDSRSGWFIIGF